MKYLQMNYQMFSLYHQKGDAVNGFLGSAKQWPETWYTLLGEYALFSNSRAGVERWLDQYVAWLSVQPAEDG